MIVKPSPLVASFHGSAGEATASTWLGRNYLRKRVTPRNPQSAGQTAVRESMARIVALWQSFTELADNARIKEAWNYAALKDALKGYNLFGKRNRALEQAGALLVGIADPAWSQAYGGPIPIWTDLAGAPGIPGAIDVTWTPLTAYPAFALFFVREAATNVFTYPAIYSAAEGAGALTITGMTAATSHQVYGTIYRIGDNRFGGTAAIVSLTG